MTTKTKLAGSSTGSSHTDNQAQTAHIHTSLYRKYRPDNWDKVIGQQHIVQVLREEANKVKKEGGFPGHAFLFAGSRGTGKTTIARIFAQEIGTAPEDIYEIDAASNTSVEDIRALSEAVHTLPLKSRFKVYILDEVHMLSKSAFNAFLKTLEEPPRHVIFILATTELHKIPETIMSRCQVFHFARPTVATLTEVITETVKREGFEIEPLAAERIAKLGKGSFRDTLSHLQTILTFAEVCAQGSGASGAKTGDLAGTKNYTITESTLTTVTTMPAMHYVDELVRLVQGEYDSEVVAQKDNDVIEKGNRAYCSQEMLRIVSKISETDADISIFIDMLIERLRDELLNPKTEHKNEILCMLDLLLEYSPTIGKTAIPTLPLELAVMKFCLN